MNAESRALPAARTILPGRPSGLPVRPEPEPARADLAPPRPSDAGTLRPAAVPSSLAASVPTVDPISEAVADSRFAAVGTGHPRRATTAPRRAPGRRSTRETSHRTVANRIEPAVAAALGVAALLATSTATALLSSASSGAPLPVLPAATAIREWAPVAAAAAIALAALILPGRAASMTARGLALLSAAATVAALAPERVPLALLWVLAITATYPFFLPKAAGRVIVTAGVAALATPLIAHAARSGAADPAASLLDQLDPATAASTLTLIGGMVVIVVLGGCAAAGRRTLHASATLAVRRGRDAERAAVELDRVATHDHLTGLPNRASLIRQLMLRLAHADVAGGQVALLVLEVDRYAEITDSFGPASGDEVINQVARRLRASRPAPDLVAHVAEHQFAVLVDGVGAEGCAALARRVTAVMEEPVATPGGELSITCTVGIAVSGPGVDTADEVIRASEAAMHAARRAGRSRWAIFDQAMRAHTESQATLELQLREAVRAGRIDVAFQPVIAIGGPYEDGEYDDAAAIWTRRPVAVEALARWTRADGSTVPPPRFLRVAEDLGLGVTLGMQVLEQAVRALLRWRADGLGIERICVNVLQCQLLDPEFAHMVSALLATHGLPASCLQLEISAASFVDSEQARSTLGMLRSLGIEVALDDFGRDGTSLASLRHLPVACVKLDHQLTVDLGRNDAVVRAVVQMCRELGIRTVAEGIETDQQLEAAQRIGVDAAQGYLLGGPTTADAVVTVMAAR